jgi:hypothetical protein
MSITIPESVAYLSPSAFSNCNQLVQEENGVYYIDKWVIGANAAVSITLRENTVGILEGAFSNANQLIEIILPDSVMYIGKYAFLNCERLTFVTFGKNSKLTSIGDNAFEGCNSLINISLPDDVKSIGSYAFYNCSSLTSITMPNSVTSIGYYAFSGCSSFTSITFDGTVEQWKAISLGMFWNDNVPATKVICSDGTVTYY